MLENIISFDQQLLLWLNGSDSVFWDGIWLAITKPLTWIAFYFAVTFVFLRSYGPKRTLFVLLAVGLAILLADQVASGICKPFFHRFRPTHEPLLDGKVDIVGNYRGGLYGFMSSHAANGFAICTLVSLIMRHRLATATMLLYAVLTSYSRIYLGLHYPGDILCGALWGVVSGLICYKLYDLMVGRYFPSRRYYAKTYTSTGILKDDTAIPPTFFFLTILCTFIFAIFYAAKQ